MQSSVSLALIIVVLSDQLALTTLESILHETVDIISEPYKHFGWEAVLSAVLAYVTLS